MIILNLNTVQLEIVHTKGKLKLAKSDLDAERYVTRYLPNCKLLGTFPNPSELIDIVIKEHANANKKETKKPSRSKG